MSKTRKVLLTLLALALLTPPLRTLLVAMLPDMSVNAVPGCIAGMALTLLTMALPAGWLHPWTSPRLTPQKNLCAGLVLAVAAALLTRATMTPADAAWQGALRLTDSAMPVPQSVPQAMLYIAALVIVSALAEEAFFRGALLTGLLDGARRVTAVLVTTLTFALMHGNLAHLPSLLLLSALLTLLMLHTGHIAVPMTAHLVYNLTALNWMNVPGWASLLCGAGVIALAAGLIVRQPKIAHPPMKKADGVIVLLAVASMMMSYLC